MANQLNYTTPVTGVLQRPDRIAASDLALIETGEKQIVFGTDPSDNVEVWVYNPDGSFAGSLRLDVTDPALVVSTIIDNSGNHEVLNVDMRSVGQRMALESGRYGLVMNFFRDEVGSMIGPKLYLADISPDRTEVLLKPVDVTDDMRTQVFEFVEPSVPKLYAKALVDQIFGRAIAAPANQKVSVELLNALLEQIRDGFLTCVVNAELIPAYSTIVFKVLDRTYTEAINLMAADTNNHNVQRDEIEHYIITALNSVVAQMKLNGEIDPRFELR
jgi:hypothetical protein